MPATRPCSLSHSESSDSDATMLASCPGAQNTTGDSSVACNSQGNASVSSPAKKKRKGKHHDFNAALEQHREIIELVYLEEKSTLSTTLQYLQNKCKLQLPPTAEGLLQKKLNGWGYFKNDNQKKGRVVSRNSKGAQRMTLAALQRPVLGPEELLKEAPESMQAMIQHIWEAVVQLFCKDSISSNVADYSATSGSLHISLTTSSAWRKALDKCQAISTLAKLRSPSLMNHEILQMFQCLDQGVEQVDHGLLVYFWRIAASIRHFRRSHTQKQPQNIYTLLWCLLVYLQLRFCYRFGWRSPLAQFFRWLLYWFSNQKISPKEFKMILGRAYDLTISHIATVAPHCKAITMSMRAHYYKNWNEESLQEAANKQSLQSYYSDSQHPHSIDKSIDFRLESIQAMPDRTCDQAAAVRLYIETKKRCEERANEGSLAYNDCTQAFVKTGRIVSTLLDERRHRENEKTKKQKKHGKHTDNRGNRSKDAAEVRDALQKAGVRCKFLQLDQMIEMLRYGDDECRIEAAGLSSRRSQLIKIAKCRKPLKSFFDPDIAWEFLLWPTDMDIPRPNNDGHGKTTADLSDHDLLKLNSIKVCFENECSKERKRVAVIKKTISSREVRWLSPNQGQSYAHADKSKEGQPGASGSGRPKRNKRNTGFRLKESLLYDSLRLDIL